MYWQPVAMGIGADQKAFQFYCGGVLPARRYGTSLDHGVLLVIYIYIRVCIYMHMHAYIYMYSGFWV
jgi:hypothetical protein